MICLPQAGFVPDLTLWGGIWATGNFKGGASATAELGILVVFLFDRFFFETGGFGEKEMDGAFIGESWKSELFWAYGCWFKSSYFLLAWDDAGKRSQ